VLLFFQATWTRGADDNWMGPSNGNFNDGAMWTDGTPPGFYDTAVFDVAATYTVSFASPGESERFRVMQGDVTFKNLGGGSYHAYREGAGSEGGVDGTLTVDGNGGPFVVETAGSDVSGTLNITNGAIWDNVGFLQLSGALNIDNNGSLGGHGAIMVDGGVLTRSPTGTCFEDGGDLFVQNGGRVTLQGDCASLHYMVISIDGPGSILETTNGGSTTLGGSFHELEISDQGALSTSGALDAMGHIDVGSAGSLSAGTQLNIGTQADCNLTISGFGSMLTVGDDVTVGAGGAWGGLCISDGARATVGGAIHAASSDESGDQADIRVRSGSSLEVGGDIHVGAAGLPNQYARFHVEGAWVEQTGDSVLTVGAEGWGGSQGVLEVREWGGGFTAGAGTVLNETGRIIIDGGEVDLKELTVNGGTIDFRRGDLSLIGDVTVCEDGLFEDEVLDMYDHDLTVEGTVTVERLGAVILDDGFLETEALIVLGAVYLDEGAVWVEEDLTIGDGAPPGAQVAMGDEGLLLLAADGQTTVNAMSRLTVGSGEFLSGSLTNSGAVALTGGISSIAGPVTVNPGGSLTVEDGSLAAATLVNAGTVVLDGSASHVAAGSLTNEATGLLLVGRTASLHVAEATNAGELVLDSGAARILGTGTLTNTGLIRGGGTISMPVTNAAGGEIRAEIGERLKLAGANGTNQGTISLHGGAIEFAQTLTNGAAGNIVGRGTFLSGGLTNQGDIGLSSGTTDVYGDVINDTGGRVIVSGRADVTFWDDVHNQGAFFKVSADSSATFFGAYSGGPVSGAGHVYVEGEVAPGFSPAMIDFGGNVSFGPLANLQIELAESDNSDADHPRYDALRIAGDVDLAGMLSLTWLPRADDPNSRFGGMYDVVTYAADKLTGEFVATGGNIGEAYVASVECDADLGDGHHAVRITLHELIDGDADVDGGVDRSDFLALRDGFGSAGADWFAGDFTFDGEVTHLDYVTLKRRIGESVLEGGTIPEPATLVLLAFGGLGVLLRRRT